MADETKPQPETVNPTVQFLVQELKGAIADGEPLVSESVQVLADETSALGQVQLAYNVSCALLLLVAVYPLTVGMRAFWQRMDAADTTDAATGWGIGACILGALAVVAVMSGLGTLVSQDTALTMWLAPHLYLLQQVIQ